MSLLSELIAHLDAAPAVLVDVVAVQGSVPREPGAWMAVTAAGQIDMMISDVIMPGLDGPSLLKKARPYLGDAPVMFISGYAESDFSDLLQDEVGVSFLPKPLDIKTLAERVKQELHAG